MIEIFASADGWRFRVVGANGEVQAQSEAYTRPGDAQRGAHDLVATILSSLTTVIRMEEPEATLEMKPE